MAARRAARQAAQLRPHERAALDARGGLAHRRLLPAAAAARRPARPSPAGLWERARELLRDYEFADPRIVRAVYAPGRPTRGPRHAARGSVLGAGASASASGWRRDRRAPPGRAAGRCASGAGATHAPGPPRDGPDGLRGLEVASTTGAVEFRIHVVSRSSRIGNPIVRLRLSPLRPPRAGPVRASGRASGWPVS